MNIAIERPKGMKKILSVLLPVVIVLVAVGASALLVMAKPEPEKKDVVEIARNIRVVTAHQSRVILSVSTQGTVEAKQMIDLVPQVSGQVVFVSDKFVAGGLFKKGEVILRLDPRDYQYAVTSAAARVTESQQFLIRERAEAALAKTEWDLLGSGDASDLTLRKPQLADAEAKLGATQAALRIAELNLERSEIRTPFNGLLTSKNVDLGQFLSPGSKVGKYFSTDVLEVRLPLSSRDLAQFDLTKFYAGESNLDVTLTGEFAGQKNVWQGRIMRTEGLINSKTRIMFVVAQLKGEQLEAMHSHMPLSIGQFVTAEIEGRVYDNAFQLPRDVLRQGNQILVVDKDKKLHTRTVKVVESNRNFVVITEGIQEGDIICKSQLGVDVDGLLVKYALDQGATS
ncbi:MAG: efflux transporter periplasmic adaptor subunit [Alphaproteobacteria bacterium]|nr:MAG: efflux transporter periplasmic adaptor subunit [Alphaproteobacteria bacterium]